MQSISGIRRDKYLNFFSQILKRDIASLSISHVVEKPAAVARVMQSLTFRRLSLSLY